jgi:O-methyltransferase involved in polyketide biosynthesis
VPYSYYHHNVNFIVFTKSSLTKAKALTPASLRTDTPTLFVWEALLFYVKPDAVINIFDDVFNFGTNSVYCLVDSLKPAVTTSFLHGRRASSSISTV